MRSITHLVSALAISCGTAFSAPADPVIAPSAGRLLSASCFQCHSSSGFEGITGESASEIVSELKEMRSRRVPEGIMDLVARGLTDAQIQEIANYLATLPSTEDSD
jgi:cytochrome c553